MNTLPRALAARLLTDPPTRSALRRRWRALLHSERRHSLTAAHHLLYLALQGRDWRRGFTPPTNRRKLANGAFYGWALFEALAKLQRRSAEAELLAPFEGLVTPAMLAQVRRWVPAQSAYQFRPEHFTAGAFPFPAYLPDADQPEPGAHA